MAHIRYQKGNIFDSNTHVIVNTVNCEGFMGKGLALAFKQRYPEMFPVYQQECKTGKLRIGHPTLYQCSTPWILNFPTKNFWRPPSKLEYLEKGLKYFVANYKKVGIKSIAFPKLGAQNGKLSWDEVGPLMAKYLSQVDIDVYIYIAEGDKEYYYDQGVEHAAKESIWQHFNELALVEKRLKEEVHLNARDAKRVMEKRMIAEFTSLTDIESIEKIAKVSLKRIKDYIKLQEFSKPELIGIEQASPSSIQAVKKPAKAKRKKSDTVKQVPPNEDVESLFPKELVG